MLCYCNSLPSGTFHGPTRLFCRPGLRLGCLFPWCQCFLVFFFLFACFSSWLGRLSAPARGFFGPFVFCFFFPCPFAVALFSGKALGYAFWSSAILYIEAFQGGVGESGQRAGAMLAGWQGELCCAPQSVGVLAGSSFPQGNGRGKEGASVGLSRSYDEEYGVLSSPPSSGPTSGVVGGLCHNILQNCVEGPSVHIVS